MNLSRGKSGLKSKNKFHGGDRPDNADLELLAVLTSKYQSNSFQSFLKEEMNEDFQKWMMNMQIIFKNYFEELTYSQ